MQRLDVQLEDDLTGGPADETVLFGVDGRDYQIDLNAKHAATFRKQLAAFIKRARSVRPTRGRSAARSAASRDRSRQIRGWAEQQGFKVAAHGRLPAHVIQEYDRASVDGQPARRRKSVAPRQPKRNQ
jgi:hypothetical protein